MQESHIRNQVKIMMDRMRRNYSVATVAVVEDRSASCAALASALRLKIRNLLFEEFVAGPFQVIHSPSLF